MRVRISLIKNLILFGYFFTFISCNNSTNETIPEVKEVIVLDQNSSNQINHALTYLEVESQKFKVSPHTKTTLEGKKGTKIHIDPQDYELHNGNAVLGPIYVKFIEAVEKIDIFSNSLPISINGKPIKDGGIFYVQMFTQSYELKLKPDRQPKIVPKSNRNQNYFIGQRREDLSIEWTQSPQTDLDTNSNVDMVFLLIE